MKRRDFFRLGSGSAVAVGLSAIASPAEARNFSSPRIERTGRDATYPPAAPAVADEFAVLLLWMQRQGWSPVLRRIAGFDLDAAIAGGDEALFAELKFARTDSLREFGGKRAIQPGDPAMSLLYHVLAASEAVYPELTAAAYPGAAQIDALENYIFDRTNVVPAPDMELAVFAYEYRQAFKTPHRAHADMVYTRAGVSRTGTQDCKYDPLLREYGAPRARSGAAQACATVPARFGLFLARRMDKHSLDRIASNTQDDDFRFLLPVCKLVGGGRLLGGRGIQFGQSHRDEKLLRLMREVEDRGEGFDLDRPPFLRKSMSEDGPDGARVFDEQTSALVAIRSLRGSARIFPAARPIVRPALQGGRIARFLAPAERSGLTGNRRYSSLKLVQDPRAEGIDAFFSDFLFRGGKPTTGLRAARNAPSFVYIRAEVEGDDTISHLGASEAHRDRIAAGGYKAALFEDGLCDGCVTARITGSPTEETGIDLPARTILPAISFVAAPDFFPRVDPLDLEDFDPMFLEGGTESASGLRLPANPLIELPGQPGTSAFPLIPRGPIAATMTAAVSCPAEKGATYVAHGYARSSALNTLTDTVSNVFFPGWDVTYSNEAGIAKDRFLASFGLGSPFPEDMKLCAAANGMWAGASPDASRTFYPTLEPLPALGRPATAVPLMDDELGYHPASPAVAEWQAVAGGSFGWDGEHGPFVEIVPDAAGTAQLRVNCTDIMLSDYVRNALDGRMDLGRMQNLHNRDLIDRMAMLKASIAALPRGGSVAKSDMWLVSAEQVADWAKGAAGLGVPRALAPRTGDRIAAAPGIAGKGFLYLFAHCPSPKAPIVRPPDRQSFAVRRLYLCHGDGQNMRYARLDPLRPSPAPLDWSRLHALRYR